MDSAWLSKALWQKSRCSCSMCSSMAIAHGACMKKALPSTSMQAALQAQLACASTPSQEATESVAAAISSICSSHPWRLSSRASAHDRILQLPVSGVLFAQYILSCPAHHRAPESTLLLCMLQKGRLYSPHTPDDSLAKFSKNAGLVLTVLLPAGHSIILSSSCASC